MPARFTYRLENEPAYRELEFFLKFSYGIEENIDGDCILYFWPLSSVTLV